MRSSAVQAGALALLLILTASGCARGSAAPASPPLLRIGFGIGRSAQQEGVKILADNLYAEGLLRHDWTGRTQPSLVGGWHWSDDHKKLTLNLKQGVLFHDGSVLSSDTVVQFLRKLQQKSLQGFRYVTAIDAVDQNTVEVRLSRRDTFLLTDMSDLRLTHPDNPEIATGPFKIVSRAPVVDLNRFDRYHSGPSPLAGVKIITYDTPRRAWSALMRGEVDVVQEVTRESVEFLENNSRLRTFSSIQPFYIPLFLNHEHPALGNREVRLALLESLDRQAVVKVGMNGLGQVTDTPIWPMHWAYSPPPGSHNHSPSSARERLDRNGFPLRDGGVGQPRSRFTFRCLFFSEDSQYERIALILQRQLVDVGVELLLEPVGMKELGERAAAGNFDSMLVPGNASKSLNYAYKFWRSKSDDNTPVVRTGYTGADAAFDRFRFSTSESETRAAVAELTRRYFEDVPALFIAWTEMTRAVDSSFTFEETQGRDPFASIWQWRRTNTSRN